MKLSQEAKERNGYQLLGIITEYIVYSIVEGNFKFGEWSYADRFFYLLIALVICHYVNLFIDLKYRK